MFDGLSISITGSGRDAQSAVRGVRESLQDARDAALGLVPGMNAAGESMDETASDAAGLSLALRGVRSQADEAGDELTQTGAQATAAAGGLTTAAAASRGTGLSFMGLSTTTSLALIPSLLTLSTTLAPLAAAFTAVALGAGSLVGAFGSLIGAGLLAWGQQAADRMAGVSSATEALSKIAGGLKQQLAEVIAPLGQTFVPLLREAAFALPGVVEEMVAAVGSTEEFRSTLRQFGGVAADVLPALTRAMFAFARRALPVARDFFGFLRSNGPSAFRAIMASVRELTPQWNAFLDALIDMGPVLLEFGTHVANVVLPALTGLVRGATGFMDTVNNLTPGVRALTIGVLALAPAITGVGTALSGLSLALGGSGLLGLLTGSGGVTAAIGGGGAAGLGGALVALATGPVGIAVAAIAGLAIAWETDLGNMRSQTRQAVADINSYFSNLNTPLGERGMPGSDSLNSRLIQGMEGFEEYKREQEKKSPSEREWTSESLAPTSGASTGLEKYREMLSGGTPDWYQDVFSESAAEQQGEQAGQAAARGFQSGLQGVTIRSDGLTPQIRRALMGGVPGYVDSPEELEDAPTKITPDLFRAVASQPGGASAESLGVSQQEYQILRQRYQTGSGGSVSSATASAMPSATSSDGLPSTGLSSLQPIISKFESAVDKFARVAENMEVVVSVDDGEFARAIDARVQQNSQQTAQQARNNGVWRTR